MSWRRKEQGISSNDFDLFGSGYLGFSTQGFTCLLFKLVVGAIHQGTKKQDIIKAGTWNHLNRDLVRI